MKRTWLWIGVAGVALALLWLPSLGIGAGQVLLFVLLLACPLLHFFGMHRHGGHAHGRGNAAEPPAPATEARRLPATDRDET